MEVVHVFRKKHAVADLRTRLDRTNHQETKHMIPRYTKVVHQIACGKNDCRQTNAKQAST